MGGGKKKKIDKFVNKIKLTEINGISKMIF
jgi:hypothetical protein